MVKGLSPRMEHCDNADLGAKMPGLGGNGAQRLGGGPHQDVVDHGLVVERDLGRGRGRRQREYDMEIGTGSRSARRASSHSARARFWHLGQCRLRQEL